MVTLNDFFEDMKRSSNKFLNIGVLEKKTTKKNGYKKIFWKFSEISNIDKKWGRVPQCTNMNTKNMRRKFQ